MNNYLLLSTFDLLGRQYSMGNQETENTFYSLLASDVNAAYSFLVKQYSGYVFNSCLNQVYNKEDAEDLTQEVFIAIYTSLNSFQSNSKLSTWIYSIILNKTREFHRKNSRLKRKGHHKDLDDETSGPVFHDRLTSFDHPGVILENKEKSEVLFSAIHQLSENQREAYILNKIDGLSYQEVAEITGQTVSSVESLLFRARKNLKTLLSDYYEKNMR